MATNLAHMRAEESVKAGLLETCKLKKLKTSSYIELKKFDKNEYAELVLKEKHKLLPDLEFSQLKETAR